MCFIFNEKLTNDLKNKVKDQEWVEMYKVFEIPYPTDEYFQLGYLYSPYKYYKFEEGENIDDNFLNTKYKDGDEVEYCFHCFDSFDDAVKVFEDEPFNFRLVKIYVKPEDIIAMGPLERFSINFNGIYDTVGVKAFTINKEDYENALTRKTLI